MEKRLVLSAHRPVETLRIHASLVARSPSQPQRGVQTLCCVCVGLLVARRLLKKLELDETYAGQEEADGEMYEVGRARGTGWAG